MAVLTVTNLTETLANNGEQPFAIGGSGLEIEVFKLAPASGAAIAPGDTATLTPRFISNIRAIIGSTVPVTHDLDPTLVETSVALTVRGTGVTSSNDAWAYVTILGRR